MAKPTTHGLRHGKKLEVHGVVLVADTKDLEWVMLRAPDGRPVARQRRHDAGQRWPQSMTNPTEPYLAYPLQTWDGATHSWQDYDSDAYQGAIRFQAFLSRLDWDLKVMGLIP
jgi:hypothetical protein